MAMKESVDIHIFQKITSIMYHRIYSIIKNLPSKMNFTWFININFQNSDLHALTSKNQVQCFDLYIMHIKVLINES